MRISEIAYPNPSVQTFDQSRLNRQAVYVPTTPIYTRLSVATTKSVGQIVSHLCKDRQLGLRWLYSGVEYGYRGVSRTYLRAICDCVSEEEGEGKEKDRRVTGRERETELQGPRHPHPSEQARSAIGKASPSVPPR
ncbi:hypothetical protein Scep_023749 [Stephania cephalantha]|uniref:Uncharacterized protein n=1 Tax=Stephania cephalantha TaxID=152367 RepID=A0AAP0HXP9_9MAGN